VEQRLSEIRFKYERTSKDYDDIRAKLQEAELAENLESQQKAERFVLLEAPALPIEPQRPDRLKLLAMALVLAVGAGVGVAFVAGLLDQKVQDPSNLRSLIGERALAVLPYVDAPHERASRMGAFALQSVALVCVLGLSVWLTQRYADPLADLLRKFYY